MKAIRSKCVGRFFVASLVHHYVLCICAEKSMYLLWEVHVSEGGSVVLVCSAAWSWRVGGQGVVRSVVGAMVRSRSLTKFGRGITSPRNRHHNHARLQGRHNLRGQRSVCIAC